MSITDRFLDTLIKNLQKIRNKRKKKRKSKRVASKKKPRKPAKKKISRKSPLKRSKGKTSSRKTSKSKPSPQKPVKKIKKKAVKKTKGMKKKTTKTSSKKAVAPKKQTPSKKKAKTPSVAKAAKNKPPVKPAVKETCVGEITHFFSRIKVVVVKMTKEEIRVGEKIRIKGKGTDLVQKIGSLQIESIDVKKARRGQLVGLKVDKEVKVGCKVYKIGVR